MRLEFDRGTIVAREVASDAPITGALRWDARVGVHCAPAHLYPTLVRELANGGGGVIDEVARLFGPVGEWGAVGLRPYQEDALLAWQLAGQRGVVVLPTGAGKTRVALAAMARTRLPALVMVPTRVLVDQWMRAIAEVYRGEVGCYGDGHRRAAPVTVATFESAYRNAWDLGNRFGLLVCDEAHHFGGGIRDEALEMSIADARLGLTATPSESPRVAELIGPTVYRLAVADLAGRYLASFDLVTMRLRLDRFERATYQRCMATFHEVHSRFRALRPQASWAEFARAAGATETGRRALAAFRRSRRILAYPDAKRRALAALLDRHRSSRVLVFVADNDTAYDVAREHLVMPLTCDIGRAERAQALARFAAGELRVLVSARVLNEGIDVPAADVGVVVAGAHGVREHVQRIGRLLRPAPGKRAVLYELVVDDSSEVRLSAQRRRALAARSPAQL